MRPARCSCLACSPIAVDFESFTRIALIQTEPPHSVSTRRRGMRIGDRSDRSFSRSPSCQTAPSWPARSMPAAVMFRGALAERRSRRGHPREVSPARLPSRHARSLLPTVCWLCSYQTRCVRGSRNECRIFRRAPSRTIPAALVLLLFACSSWKASANSVSTLWCS